MADKAQRLLSHRLILDEATNATDIVTERAVLDNIRRAFVVRRS